MTPTFEEISCCPHCGEPSEERFSGDEGWTFCSGECGCIEFEGSETRYCCSECGDIFDEPICACHPRI